MSESFLTFLLSQMNVVLIIPARLNAVRLPQKPLADVNGKPLIVRVWEQAQASQTGSVWVAGCHSQFVDVMAKVGGQCVLTDPDLPSGTDRVWQAYQNLSLKADIVVNVQGDMAYFEPSVIKDTVKALKNNPSWDIATPIHPITKDQALEPQCVKAVRDLNDRAHYFSRSLIPHGASSFLGHIGIYAYRPKALEQFVKAPPSYLETCEKLEQLRALELGLVIGTCQVNCQPLSVDTPEDLERARAFWREREEK